MSLRGTGNPALFPLDQGLLHVVRERRLGAMVTVLPHESMQEPWLLMDCQGLSGELAAYLKEFFL